MSKHNAYLKDRNLLTLFSLNNLIIPEIQREYVWGNNPDNVLESFLEELKMKASPCETCHRVHTNKNINVGFLYSYKPQYVKYESARILDELLIDGQQRVTSLVLLLLYRAVLENRLDDFLSIFRVEDGTTDMGFNYKVRTLTQQFLRQLIDQAQKEGESAFAFLSPSNTPSWYLDDYRNDPTIKAMTSALVFINRIFGDKSDYYFDFLLTNVHFWHFKTEATSQGEELYITMNSRGEQLTENEMKKARRLPTESLVEYGRDWESWQTFFWRNRKKGCKSHPNPNADKGFNNFLNCIDSFTAFHNDKNAEVADIKIFMQALMYICSDDFSEKLHQEYSGLYTDWFKQFIEYLWQEINGYDGSWVITNPKDSEARNRYNNQASIRNKSMLFWPWMCYFKKYSDEIDDILLIHILHFYYVRYRCYKRSSTSIEKIVDIFKRTNGGIHLQNDDTTDAGEDDNPNSRIFSDEELLLSRLAASDPSATKKIEAAIWEVQELPYFIDGKGVGGNTVYNLFADEDIIRQSKALSDIKTFKARIVGLLGDDSNSRIDIKRLLLFYVSDNKCFWQQQSPWYYSNYETSEWNRIVRTKHFEMLYKDYSSSGKDTDVLLEEKRSEFFKEISKIDRNGQHWSHRKLLILYDLLSNDGVWDTWHENIAIDGNEECVEEIFTNQPCIFKGKRYKDASAKVSLRGDWRDVLLSYGVSVVEPMKETSQLDAEGGQAI
ncbi:MAG: DUF262 domain-containing protein [Muribaculaceae bacterium]|nr:DUF262 domain-containing protein [Muribaculaceae bacterium]